MVSAVAGMFVGPVLAAQYGALLMLWFILGLGYSIAQTPTGRLLRRSAHPEDRPAVFAAQFALSHACWLVTYPLAGWFGAKAGLGPTFIVLGFIAAISAALAWYVWPAPDLDEIAHIHTGLSADDAHASGTLRLDDEKKHAHHFVIDKHHGQWPEPGPKRK